MRRQKRAGPVPTVTRTARASKPARVQRKTVVDLAVEQMREHILRGDYPEGSPLRQDALAAELGVSRIPVREALRQLEVEGLVTFSPHAGAVVSTLSLDEIVELFQLRALLESDLMRKAVPNLTPDVLDRAFTILEAYDAAFEAGDVAEWGALNWEFHSTLLAAAQRPLTLGVLSMLHNQSDRYTRLQLTLTHGEVRASDEHKAIATAAAMGDAELAAKRMRAHVESACASLIDFLREHRKSAGQS
ncbi:MAG: GntR family transcriptional regulator [Longimicrobiales bacterium]